MDAIRSRADPLLNGRAQLLYVRRFRALTGIREAWLRTPPLQRGGNARPEPSCEALRAAKQDAAVLRDALVRCRGGMLVRRMVDDVCLPSTPDDMPPCLAPGRTGGPGLQCLLLGLDALASVERRTSTGSPRSGFA
jgi:hypothetical protein